MHDYTIQSLPFQDTPNRIYNISDLLILTRARGADCGEPWGLRWHAIIQLTS